jgi:hypothetical protein
MSMYFSLNLYHIPSIFAKEIFFFKLPLISENMRNILNFTRNIIFYYQARPSQDSNSSSMDR